jgi:hypothetical protein
MSLVELDLGLRSGSGPSFWTFQRSTSRQPRQQNISKLIMLCTNLQQEDDLYDEDRKTVVTGDACLRLCNAMLPAGPGPEKQVQSPKHLIWCRYYCIRILHPWCASYLT